MIEVVVEEDDRITVVGVARDAAAGAVVIDDAGVTFFVAGLEAWPASVGRARVRVTGRHRTRALGPAPTLNERGEHAAGMQGESSVLEDARWSRCDAVRVREQSSGFEWTRDGAPLDTSRAVYASARAEAESHLDAGAVDAARAMLSHPDHRVREAVAAALAAAAERDSGPEHVAPLVDALHDPASGVVCEAIAGLSSLAEAGVDLGAVEAKLERAMSGLRYSIEDGHWTFETFRDRDHETDVTWDPRVGVARLLATHHLHRGRHAAVEASMAAKGPRMLGAWLAIRAFARTAEGRTRAEELRRLEALLDPDGG